MHGAATQLSIFDPPSPLSSASLPSLPPSLEPNWIAIERGHIGPWAYGIDHEDMPLCLMRVRFRLETDAGAFCYQGMSFSALHFVNNLLLWLRDGVPGMHRHWLRDTRYPDKHDNAWKEDSP